jgi:hypothetical protein
MRRSQLLRIVRSLGLVFFRELILDRMGISLYGTFSRPPEWGEPPPNRFSAVDRLLFRENGAVEYQYSTDFEQLIVREHQRNEKYGPDATRQPTGRDIKLLMLASNRFPFWYLVYGLKRPQVWLRGLFRRALEKG